MGGCASRAVTRAPSSLDCRGKQHSAVIASLDCRAVQQTGAIDATDRLGEGSKSWVVTPHVLQDALRCISCGLLMSGLLLGAGASASAAEEDSMQPQYYLQQVQDAMPLKTMRGVWRFKEKREGRTCTGRLTFQGKLDEPNRGDVVYENLEGGAAMCYSPTPPAKAVKGKWLMKPAKFESKETGSGTTMGTIQFNARWKLRTAQGTFIYRGDISADPIKGSGNVPDAVIKGEILKDKGNENYKRVGSFEGDLKEFLPAPDDLEDADLLETE